ncbi:hypothetical protein HHO38_17090 [Parabacteroides distasonis]|jgi:Lanthionine synthetase C-like protein.|uniref:Lanthionine synthetase C-like protein n=1 Tax=Parabacteroides distasonis TaxID=823 RepID=A0A7L5EFH8_PARDI|nr:lanthionine synthetase LanC family protein [Parabacteroides distasonis]EEY83750.1 hypothetical protein HMPREF0103_1991 [Bacteroides sp. 2_1_33B]QJE29907.1 hypothetical protein HHO38_17090 [Parabacteroides distasonis]WRY45353.1 lanthionine synthetase LanC family protein [Parabacteroides distasonis]
MNDKDLLLRRIANHLTINASFLDNCGLFYGKMGIALFFAHYSRYTNNESFEDYMEVLLKDIYMELDESSSMDLQSGLCGIGWGIIHLLKNQFVEGDPSLIFKDIDSTLLSFNFMKGKTRKQDLSFYINERISLGNYDSRLIELMPYPIKNSDDINQFISSSIKLNNNIRDWELGLHHGCSGLAIKMMSK